MRVRRVDFYADDWIAGTGELSTVERGVYVTACALIYSRGGPITRDHLGNACPGHRRPFNAALDRLLDLGKLIEVDGKLDQNRCETELKHARNRIETSQKNGQKGGRPSSDNSAIAKPGGSSRAREGETKTTTTTNLRESGEVGPGRSAPLAAEPVDHSAVDRVVAAATAQLRGQARRPGRAVCDLVAYDAVVESTVWDAWLNRLARAIMAHDLRQDPAAAVPDLEMIEEARKAGSRAATAPHIRKRLNELDRAERARRKNERAA